MLGLSRIKWKDEEKQVILEEDTTETPSQPMKKLGCNEGQGKKQTGLRFINNEFGNTSI